MMAMSAMPLRRWIVFLIATAGVAGVAYAVQVRTWHGRGSWTGEPEHKRLVAAWLASELWIDPVVLAADLTMLVLALVPFHVGRRDGPPGQTYV